jgi:hypothetical protein
MERPRRTWPAHRRWQRLRDPPHTSRLHSRTADTLLAVRAYPLLERTRTQQRTRLTPRPSSTSRNVWRIPRSLRSTSPGPVRRGRSVGMTLCATPAKARANSPPLPLAGEGAGGRGQPGNAPPPVETLHHSRGQPAHAPNTATRAGLAPFPAAGGRPLEHRNRRNAHISPSPPRNTSCTPPAPNRRTEIERQTGVDRGQRGGNACARARR